MYQGSLFQNEGKSNFSRNHKLVAGVRAITAHGRVSPHYFVWSAQCLKKKRSKTGNPPGCTTSSSVLFLFSPLSSTFHMLWYC